MNRRIVFPRILLTTLFMLAFACLGGGWAHAAETPALPAALKPTDPHVKLVLVEFYTPWCLDCQLLKPEVTKLSSELGAGLKVVTINMEQSANQAYVRRYRVLAAPTVILFNGAGKPLHRLGSEVRPKDLRRAVLHYYAPPQRQSSH